jgi:murein DD-endopeptidase MepM/ murein hydrolase activator NlpD
MAIDNLNTPSDAEGLGFGVNNTGGMDEAIKILSKGMAQFLKDAVKAGATVKDMEKSAAKISQYLTGKKINDLGLGLGEMPTFKNIWGAMTPMQKGIIGAGTLGSLGMGLLPNTQQAVGLRTSADMYAGLSGLTPNQAINQANAVARAGGATSATGPTMAAMNIAYTGGYLANTASSKNIMSQLGGLSALTGMTNEQAAGAAAGANGMSFLRMGVRIRDANGQLRPMSDIINDVWNFIYRGRTDITKDEAMMLLNPGSPGGTSIRRIAGDPNLANEIIMGIVARAGNKGNPLTAKQLSSAKTSLGLLGVQGTSPLATAFNYNSKQANYLQSTYQGQVSGYNMSLNAASDITSGLTGMANELGPVTALLGQLKGVLQTFPGLGGVGGTLSGLGGLGMSIGMQGMQAKIMGQYLAKAASGGTIAEEAGAAASRLGSVSKVFSALRFLGPAATAVGAGVSGFAQGKQHNGFGYGSLFGALGSGALAGGLTFGIPGAIAGGLGSAAINALGQLFGSGGPETSSTGLSSNASGGQLGSSLGIPTSGDTVVTSPFGQRKADHGIKAGFHPGIDLGLKEGTPVKVTADGTVTYVGNGRGYGNHVIVNHGDKSTLYAHLRSIIVRNGQKVKAGQIIGLSGGKKGAPGSGNSTGPHLHYEVRDKSGRAVNPLSAKNSKGIRTKYDYNMSDNDSPLGNATTTNSRHMQSSLSSQDVSAMLADGNPGSVVGKIFGNKAYSNGKLLSGYSGTILGTGDQKNWAKTLLEKLHYPTSKANVEALTTWMAWEGGHWHNSDHYNPLNTTMPMPGAISTNKEGVKSFTSWDQGYQATIKTLNNGLYGPVLKALSAGNNSRAVLKAVNHSKWGTHIPGIGGPDGSGGSSTVGSSTGGGNLSSTNITVNVGGIKVQSNKSGPVGVELIINEVTKQVAAKMRKDLLGKY